MVFVDVLVEAVVVLAPLVYDFVLGLAEGVAIGLVVADLLRHFGGIL
jgi:hypothetical protein